MLDLFRVDTTVYGHGAETLLVWDSNEASACETARFHYNSNLRNQIDGCSMIACGWEPEHVPVY